MKGLIIVAGTTGAGKTTHAKILAERTGATYISSGDIARGFMDAKTDELFKEGQLSPHEDRIRTEIHRKIEASEVAILDGFPRTKDQFVWLSSSTSAALYMVLLDWPIKVLVNRWVSRSRDDYDSLSAYVKRDELYRRETLPLFKDVHFVTNHEFEQETMDISCVIRENVIRWLVEAVPTFKCKDSPKAVAISKFVHDHHVTYWHPDRTRTYSMLDADIEKKLWSIVNA